MVEKAEEEGRRAAKTTRGPFSLPLTLQRNGINKGEKRLR